MPDRDRYVPKHSTPATGTSTSTRAPSSAEGEFTTEADSGIDLTPVESTDPLTQASGRARQAAVSSKTAVKMVRVLQDGQNTLARQVREYAENDKADHASMKSDINETKDKIDAVDAKVDSVIGHVTDLRVDVGKVVSKLEVMAPAYDLRLRNQAHAERVRLDYRTGIKTAVWKTVLKVVSAVVIAVGVAYGGYLVHSWTHSAAPTAPAEVAPKPATPH